MIHDAIIIIPARLHSSRLPKKVLLDLGGVPMVVRSANNARRMMPGFRSPQLLVATDSAEVAAVCEHHAIQVVMTGECRTGTDRVAEAYQTYATETGNTAQCVIGLQADEPLMHADCARTLYRHLLGHNGGHKCVCGMAKISAEEAAQNSVGTVAVADDGRLLYVTRGTIPATKDGGTKRTADEYLTEVCIRAFRPTTLEDFGRLPQGLLERTEDIEILRLVEHGIPVYMVQVPGARLAVDTPADLDRMRSIISTELSGGDA